MAMTPEGKVKARIDRILKGYAPRVWYAKMQTGGYGKSGVPDYIGCANGYMFAIEGKATAKENPTALQKLELNAIKGSGGLALVINIDNIEALEGCILDLLELPPRDPAALRM